MQHANISKVGMPTKTIAKFGAKLFSSSVRMSHNLFIASYFKFDIIKTKPYDLHMQ